MHNLEQLDDVTVPLSHGGVGVGDDAITVRRMAVDNEPTPGPMTFQERFGRYLLLEKLGSGGMAEVFKAVAEGAQGFRRVFVVKRILPAFASSPYFVSLFADEAKLSAMLHHPNLVQVYEFGAVSGIHYLSMEYLDGMDLASVLTKLSRKGERLSPSTAAFVAQQVAHGLAYAHAARDEKGQPLHLVHRDVSPENIMLLEAGTVKLFDFGIALSDQRLASSVTQGKVLKGKLGYTSPEQVTGRPLDGRSDIFSLGVVMWEMLTCRRLFAGEDDARTLYNVLERPITPPSKISPDVPKAFDAVVLRALARNPADRYPTADHLAEDLDEVLRVVSHHRTDIPHLLERVFGRRVDAHVKTMAVSNGAQPMTEHPANSDTCETIAETPQVRVSPPVFTPAIDCSQIFTPTQLWARRPESWRHRIAIIPGPVRGAGALITALVVVAVLRSLAVPSVSTEKGITPVATQQVTNEPASSGLTLTQLPVRASGNTFALQRTKELEQSFTDALAVPFAKPKALPIQVALNVAVKTAVKKPNPTALKQVAAFKNTADVLDAVHVDPFAQ
jgi:serine/threonine protein kinase